MNFYNSVKPMLNKAKSTWLFSNNISFYLNRRISFLKEDTLSLYRRSLQIKEDYEGSNLNKLTKNKLPKFER